MLAGHLYRASDPELVAMRARAHDLLRRYNRTDEHETALRASLLAELVGATSAGLVIEPPFFCDYGVHVAFGADVYLNTGCVILDCARVTIGTGCLFGPNVQILTATHPLDPEARMRGLELAHPIVIGEHCWLGGGAIVCPGVTIGAATTIGAGSVVTRDVPPRVLAAGNPCRLLRALD